MSKLPLSRKALSYLCLFLALLLLLIGCAQAGFFWLFAPILPLAILAGWLIQQRVIKLPALRLPPVRLPAFPRPTFQPPTAMQLLRAVLVIYVIEAAMALLSGGSAAVLVAGAALMLAAWELQEHAPSQSAADPAVAEAPDPAHLRLLAISVGGGLLLAEAGLLLQFPVPFGIVLLAGALVLFSANRFYRLFHS